MFISTSDLENDVAAVLQLAGASNLAVQWGTICNRTNPQAYNIIVSKLAGRGYTKAQIDTWDQGADYQSSIGTYLSLARGGVLAKYDKDVFEYLDLRDDLESVSVTIGGVFADPLGTVGQVVVAPLETELDLIVPIDDEDPRIGTPARM